MLAYQERKLQQIRLAPRLTKRASARFFFIRKYIQPVRNSMDFPLSGSMRTALCYLTSKSNIVTMAVNALHLWQWQ